MPKQQYFINKNPQDWSKHLYDEISDPIIELNLSGIYHDEYVLVVDLGKLVEISQVLIGFKISKAISSEGRLKAKPDCIILEKSFDGINF